ncbi:lactonase family protein [Fibrella sp. HMF5335]|uniref:Lactonase family protein n=1 Tax=Fibrella rubiginis TaxID=2817060 RepID=A0A939GEI4_9BACT|nr:lactonase family protein [Fibrella rubiginis]MBO0937519.1 lactonase family protein [Fibrella rubiginis]
MNIPAFLLPLLLIGTTVGLAQSSRSIDRLYVGTYSMRGSDGIYVVELDRQTGELRQTGSAKNDQNPSFLALHPNKRFLYAGNEASKGLNAVTAYAIDAKTGNLTLLNQQPAQGGGPCYISLDKTGKLAFTAAYGGGAFNAFTVSSDGQLGSSIKTEMYHGSNAANPRQDAPHAHSATVSPDGKSVYVCDLGNDRVYQYAIDAAAKMPVMPVNPPFVTVKAESGPRHMAISANGKFAYLVEELASSVAVFSRDTKTGNLTLLQDRVQTLPADFTGRSKNTSADIHLDPSGHFLYQSNRGHDALAVLRVEKDGKLTLLGHTPTGGKTPRNFWMDPRGEFVIVANQTTDNLVSFRRDAKTGMLSPTGHELKIPAPVCVISAQ